MNSYNVSHSVTDFKIKVTIFRELKNKIVCFKPAELENSCNEFQIWSSGQSTVDVGEVG